MWWRLCAEDVWHSLGIDWSWVCLGVFGCACVAERGTGVLVIGPRGTGKALLVQVPFLCPFFILSTYFCLGASPLPSISLPLSLSHLPPLVLYREAPGGFPTLTLPLSHHTL